MPKKIFAIKSFGIDLTFACLREAAPAKAGILAFDIHGEWHKRSSVRGHMKTILMKIYQKLFRAYGPRNWWPGETSFEVMVGAILTQNTSWRNVEKAIQRLKGRGVLNPEGIHDLKKSELARLIRSSGYYRIKADRLKSFINFLFKEYGGNLKRMKRERLGELRERLLGVKGVGPETADSILLYGLKKPIFVVDTYTKRILSRHAIISEKASYEEVQRLFMDHFTHDEKLFNEYHALLVHLGKTSCKRIPKCDACPLKGVRCEALGVRGKGEDYYWRATYDSRLTTGGRKWLTGKKRFGA